MIYAIKIIALSLGIAALLAAQGGRQQASEGMRQAVQLDLAGDYAGARALLQKEIDGAATPQAKAGAQRAMAMSYAFERNCAKTVEYEEKVIAYWVTCEKEEPKNAFYPGVRDTAVHQQPALRNDRGRNQTGRVASCCRE